MASGSWLSCPPPRAPSAHDAGTARVPWPGVLGQVHSGWGRAFSMVHGCSRLQHQALGSRVRWWQPWGSLPPGWAGWVAVGVGSQAGLLPTLGRAPGPQPGQLSHLGLKAWGVLPPTSRATASRGSMSLRHQELGSQGLDWCLRAFALSGKWALQTLGFSQVPARPEAAPQDPAALAPRTLADPSSCLPGWAAGRG